MNISKYICYVCTNNLHALKIIPDLKIVYSPYGLVGELFLEQNILNV